VKAPSDLQPHYGNGVFGSVYLLALDKGERDKHCRCPIAVMGVVDHLGQRRKCDDDSKRTFFFS